MDHDKIGGLICALRKERGLTQRALADLICVSDKTVSKWERGLGCPDVALLSSLADTLNVRLENLLAGDLAENDTVGGNMKKLKFYICPVCGNLLTATGDAAVSCCGKKLEAATPRKAAESERLTVENIENEYFISSGHEMTREHYIAFVALLTGDTLVLRKQYPEWDLQTRIPCIGHGTLVWHCVKHGTFYQYI